MSTDRFNTDPGIFLAEIVSRIVVVVLTLEATGCQFFALRSNLEKRKTQDKKVHGPLVNSFIMLGVHKSMA